MAKEMIVNGVHGFSQEENYVKPREKEVKEHAPTRDISLAGAMFADGFELEWR